MPKKDQCTPPLHTILISACLLGETVRYDGQSKNCDHPLLLEWHQANRLVPICPEVTGGLAVPRDPAEINGADGYAVLRKQGKILTKDGQDVTQAFIRGAKHTLRVAREHHCRVAVLTERSPSCGRNLIYDGSFSGIRKKGIGVTSALLEMSGVRVFSQFELEEVEEWIKRIGN